ncbi:hypothetical protein SEA_NEFERTHENA_42 [Microbacterium phage Neferthena]|uniref:Uncharacterized protein n=1 Tax=Microbacterium phage Neferthena TaxID=2301539 RepID=A0A385D3L9_9CAUD|nr:hypothetical protein HOT92_gp60 [Microbacterium phage Neferthena]AXQ52905.1 hypothetical protein SEA_NEFERTHENA_42 [Microbacterium phage Neferthena]
MDVEKEIERILDRISKRADEMYLLALARIYKVDPRTVLIWRATGRV